MKMQHIAVIFVIIIIPISIITSFYISTQIDTITLQTEYDTKLSDATYGAVKAFQINTVNNRYSTVSDSKIRDIEASVNTFFNSLGNSENLTKEDLKNNVPALVYTLYDGYYICTKYDNVMPIALDKAGGELILDETRLNSNEPNYGLKTYIYYSCRYKNSTKDFVVNYTLDNAITIYGKFDSSGDKKTLSGYLINTNKITDVSHDPNNVLSWSLKYDGVLIEPEILTEHVLFSDEKSGDYEYTEYNGQKFYYDNSDTIAPYYFYYNNYSKVKVVDAKTKSFLEARTKYGTDGKRHLYCTNAFEYYYNANTFTNTVRGLIGDITQADAVKSDTQARLATLSTEERNNYFSVNTGNEKIFEVSNDNDPLMSGSTFNENRIAVIRKSIETNLSAAISNYNRYSDDTYEFSMPKLNEVDWGKLTNNVSVMTFLQGIPIGHKYYNNYCVITNNNNEEVVKEENIYVITQEGENREYHMAGCKKLMETSSTILKAFANTTFMRQTVRISEGDYRYFYPQTTKVNPNNESDTALHNLTGCYYCIVNASDVYNVEQILQGVVYRKR